MKPTDSPNQVRFVTPISLGNKHALNVLSETDGGEWDMEVDGQFLRIQAKVRPEDVQGVKHDEHVTYVPLANVVYVRCEPRRIMDEEMKKSATATPVPKK